jgi:hypothetical protein
MSNRQKKKVECKGVSNNAEEDECIVVEMGSLIFDTFLSNRRQGRCTGMQARPYSVVHLIILPKIGGRNDVTVVESVGEVVYGKGGEGRIGRRRWATIGE